MADQEGGRVVVVVVAPGVVVVVVVTGTRTSQSTSRHEVAPVATVRSSFRVSAQRSARAAVHDSLLDASATGAADCASGSPAGRRRVRHHGLARPTQGAGVERLACHPSHAAPVGAASGEGGAGAGGLAGGLQGTEVPAVLRRAAARETRVLRTGQHAIAVLVDVVAADLAGPRAALRIAIVAVVGEVDSVLVLVAGRRAGHAQRGQALSGCGTRRRPDRWDCRSARPPRRRRARGRRPPPAPAASTKVIGGAAELRPARRVVGPETAAGRAADEDHPGDRAGRAQSSRPRSGSAVFCQAIAPVSRSRACTVGRCGEKTRVAGGGAEVDPPRRLVDRRGGDDAA